MPESDERAIHIGGAECLREIQARYAGCCLLSEAVPSPRTRDADTLRENAPGQSYCGVSGKEILVDAGIQTKKRLQLEPGMANCHLDPMVQLDCVHRVNHQEKIIDRVRLARLSENQRGTRGQSPSRALNGRKVR
jgi:hypothetical protein